MDGIIRVRSAAVVAVVVAVAMVATLACTLVVTRAWSVSAAPGGTDSTFVPTAGCRLADTRPAPNTVGRRSTPLGAGDVFDVAVHGANGGCTAALAVPSDAVAVALNVTAVNATATSNVRLYPANLPSVPLLSNLNVSAGAPAVPNKVDVKLSPDGRIRVFNEFGSVNVVIDVVGYYTDATLQELSRRVADLEAAQEAGVDPTVLARLDALETDTANNGVGIARLDAREPFVVSTNRDETAVLTSLTHEVVVSVTVAAPVDGQVTVISTALGFDATAGDYIDCSITTGTTVDYDYLQTYEAPGTVGSQLAGTRTFDVQPGSTTYRLVCFNDGGLLPTAAVSNSVVTAIFTPTPP